MTVVEVHVDQGGQTTFVGTARVTRLRGIDTTEFSYDDAYLGGSPWEISPDLPLRTGNAVVEGLPGVLSDSAPDAWGRNLIVRRLAAQARDAGHPAPPPTELDHLLGVNDLTRQGALRFRLGADSPFLADGSDVPRLLALESLLEATQRATDPTDPGAEDAVATLLAAGSGSLGGARPKASVVDGPTLHVAKFPHRDDAWDVMRWEAVALDLASASGLRTPAHDLLEVGHAVVLLVERFDRSGGHRIPYLSGRSLIGTRGRNEDYLALVDGITERGSHVAEDLIELWRRIALSVAINNTDDHMRNHAFLHLDNGWTLSPLFDVNPDPRPAARRVTSIAGATEPDESLRALVAAAPAFGLDPEEAERLWHDVVGVTSQWRDFAAARGLDEPAQQAFAPTLDRWSI